MATRIGIDTGGTFTDVVRAAGRGLTVHKLRSTPDDPSRAVLDGLAAVRRSADEAIDLVHGTTVGLNAVLTGSLARTVFVSNRGFEDLIEVGRQERVDLYALAPHRPAPPVPRALRIGVRCRRGAGGEVVEPLTEQEVARVATAVAAKRPEAIAIGLLHAPRDPADEHALQRALQQACPGVPITCSADLLPAFGEYERFSATILNAAIAPVVGRYTRKVADGLGDGTLRLLRSSLGILPPDEASDYPARAMFSGPAGGVLATGQVARRMQFARAAAFDMGGTSADVCLVEADMAMSTDGSIAGLPLPLPTVPVHTVAAGGGSIAFADRSGALRVGPQSAGADPGPACYGKGDEPTVTDAHVCLGHLGRETLLDGAFPIDVDAAARAVERLGTKLGLSARATAAGILTVADATMTRAILVITAERAVDPATVPIVAYGGAGGLHAASLMTRLGMPAAIVPCHPGAFSAVGIALAGEACEAATAVRRVLDRRGLDELLAHGDELLQQARTRLHGGDGNVGARTTARVVAVVRYRGQGSGLTVPLTRRLAAAFRQEHERRYGFVLDAEIEVVQLTARVERPARDVPATPLPTTTPPTGRVDAARPVRRKPPLGGAALPVHARRELSGAVDGPAVIEEATGTTLVPAGCRATPTPYGLRLERVRTTRTKRQ